MKKTTFIKNIKFLVVFLSFLFSMQLHSQCLNTNSYADVLAENNAFTQEIAWCFQANNYNTISGLISGGDYIFTASGNNGSGYVTITTTTDVVIAHGPSPLTINNISTIEVRLHVADNALCVTSDCYNTTLQYLPACPQPIDLTISSVTTTAATAAWTAGGSETLWDVEYGIEGFEQGTGTLVSDLTTATYTITSLVPGTAYEYYVKAKCTVAEQSFWSGPMAFTTFCNPVSEFYENFDAIQANEGLMPSCWLREAAFSFNVQVVDDSDSPATAPNHLSLFSWDGDSFVLLPPVNNLNAGTHRLRFKAFSSEVDTMMEVGYFTDPNNTSSFVSLSILTLPFGDASITQAYTILPGVLPAGVTVLGFKYTPTSSEDSFSGPVYIDDVRWELNSTCLEPIFASATNITDIGAELTWNAGSSETVWEIQYGPQNFVLGTGTIVSNITTLTYVLSGLMEDTNYQFYVRAICAGNGTSGWSDPYSFKTDCSSVTEFVENFDSTDSWSNVMPTCWVQAGNSSFNEVVSGSTMSEPNWLNMNGSDPVSTAYAIMPSVSNLQAGTHRLRFRANNDNPDSVLEVGYLTNTNDVATFVSLTEFQIGLSANGNNTDFSLVPILIPSGVKNLVFRNPGIPSETTNFLIDDVRWEALPVCQEPTELRLVSNQNTSATLAWVANGTATAWEVQYGAVGFDLGTGTIVPAALNPFVLGGLTSSTSYEFYVRSVCSSQTSTWTGPFKFKTLCDDVTEFSENFDSTTAWEGLIPDCWSRGSNNIYSNSVIDGSIISAPNQLNMYGFDEFGEIYTVMPSVSNLQSNTHRLRFRAQGDGSDAGALELGYMTNLNDINSFVLLQEFQIPLNTNVLDFFYTPTTVPAGIKNLVFRNRGVPDGALSVNIDDVKWELLPTVAPVCTDGLTATVDPDCGTAAVLLSWNQAPNADAYRITIGTTPGGSEILNNIEIGSGLNYTFETPTAATTYYWTIIPYNTIGFPATCVSSTFVTPNGLCYCEAEYNVGKTSGDLISNVVIAGTTLANNSSTTPENPAYTLFTGQPNYTATLQAGQSYSMTVSVGSFGNQHVAVWMDTNENGTYEENERVGYSVGSIDSSNPGTFTIDVPCSASAGLYRMRVRDAWGIGGINIEPCTEYDYGETEDYYVSVTAAILPTTPTGNTTQTINVNAVNEATIEDLVVSGINVQWFASEADALSGTNALTLGTILANATTYYAVSTDGSCLSLPLAVTVTVTLGINDFDSANFKSYPNPVTDVLTLSYSSTISSVEVYNLLGQQILMSQPNATQVQMDMSSLTAGTYMVKVIADKQVKTIKVIKN